MSDLTYEQRVELLSDRFAGSDVPEEFGYRASYSSYWANMADSLVWMVAKYEQTDTIYDILRAEEEMDDRGRFLGGSDDMFLLRHIVSLWQDTEALLATKPNLLDAPDPAEGWEGGLRQQLARALASEGKVRSDDDGFYGWQDWDYNHGSKKSPVLAVLRVWEDHWDAFEGTFTGESYHTGITGEVVLADGSVRLMRLEGEFGGVLQSVLRGVEPK